LVLTDRAGEIDFVKVLDFGIAARTESADAQKEQKLTQQGMVLGTPPYMSPEQFTGKALDSRSDIYSLGVMTYEMLAGRLPFDADTPWQWATQHMSVQPIPFEVSAPAKNIPEGMRKAILRALSKNKEDRQPTAREFFAELSDGGRMTVESHPDGGVNTSGTAAMAQVPDFNAPASPMMNAPMMSPPVMAGVPPSPMTSGRNNKSGGGKGLVIGLGAVGGILLIAIGVLAARSMSSSKDAPIVPLGTDVGGGSGSLGTGSVQNLEPLASAAPDPVNPVATAGSEKPEKVAPIETSKTGTGPASTGTTKSSTPAPAANTCDACIAAASSGNISGAASDFARCTDAAKKAQCSQAARNNAPNAVKSAALNGNCAQAKAIIAAAQSIGAASGRLGSSLAGSSCK
jgi:serine/threonine protein kinase